MANKKYKVESNYKNPDAQIEKLKAQIKNLKEQQMPDHYWGDHPLIGMSEIESGTLSKTKLNDRVYIEGYVVEKTESLLEEKGEVIKIKCCGFSFKENVN